MWLLWLLLGMMAGIILSVIRLYLILAEDIFYDGK